ncbi:MAG TPA: glycosyltransferase 87 family protein [Aquaticitalea sp.]|nr:glycosyltransferase 87 family protein [Aquaticitalea sp.]
MLNTLSFKLNKVSLLFVLLSLTFYGSFAYDLIRTDFTKLLILYSALFFLFHKLVQITKWNFKLLVVAALLSRLVFLFAIPNLSQDFYRFIWDGRMILEMMNPYLYTPESFIENGMFPFAQAQELYNGMGELNGSHYTNYPPIKQLVFAIAALFTGESILGSAIVFRICIIMADFGTLYFGTKLLERFKMPVHHIFWYLLNPLVIIELTGNLHFEGIMIFFLVWSLYLLHASKWKLAGAVLAISISVKLVPLLFLPLFYKWFKTKYSLRILTGFYLIIGITSIALFLPFYSWEFVQNYSQTVSLWFNKFEFNASLYYLARAIGYAITGFNEIATIGIIIPMMVVVVLFFMTFCRNNSSLEKLMTSMVLAGACYFFLSTTIHPWYIVTLLGLSLFTNYKFPLIWSFMVVLSYHAYANPDYQENLWIVGFEYLIVYGVFVWEVFLKGKNDEINFQKLHLDL